MGNAIPVDVNSTAGLSGAGLSIDGGRALPPAGVPVAPAQEPLLHQVPLSNYCICSIYLYGIPTLT